MKLDLYEFERRVKALLGTQYCGTCKHYAPSPGTERNKGECRKLGVKTLILHDCKEWEGKR